LHIVAASKEQPTKDDVMTAIRELGRQGGKTRAKNLSPARRREIAKKAAAARWQKKK
jgi:hypothetical protein